jgi:CDP-diacylglycerol--serine O-phosphatidyltransferase
MSDADTAMPERPKRLHINKMIPNLLTLTALAAGLTAIRFALQDRWEHAALAILAAAILDALDGRIARILKGASKFGAELDSLADFLSFGIAPAMMLYLWALQDTGRFGWALAVLFAICCALRLARFNTMAETPDRPTWTKNFFYGVPAPAGAGLVLLPMILSFQFGDEMFRRADVVSVCLIVTGALFVSAFPTFSFKKVHLPHKWVLAFLLAFALTAVGLLTNTWTTLTVILVLYLASFPFSLKMYRRRKATDRARPDHDDGMR